MFERAFRKLDAEETAKVLQFVNQKLEDSPFEGDAVQIAVQDLPFYPDHQFMEVTDHANVPARTVQAIYKPGEATILNWTNEPIYKLNEELPIRLDKENITLYVRFFFTYVRGRHGRFLIVESVDDIQWKDDPPPAARKAVSKLIQPVTITDIAEDGTTTVLANMVFKDSLFRAKVHVSSKGAISMSEEELLIENMPVMDDLLG
jgi:hypothetical protein